jgi:thymidylate synthase ThyX
MSKEIKSELLLASYNEATGDILYTFKWTYPRFILAEVNTHRMFSRNTSSSRAVPLKKQRRLVLQDPVIPIHIGTNQKGMQAGEEITGWKRKLVIQLWKLPLRVAAFSHWAMEKLNVHKQIANRLLETWLWTEQVVSATALENFFHLRDHKDAEPHFKELAHMAHIQALAIREVFAAIQKGKIDRSQLAKPQFGYEYMINREKHKTIMQFLQPGEWHLPFIETEDVSAAAVTADGLGIHDTGERDSYIIERLKAVSAARAARVSYFLPETGERSSYDKDMDRFKSLVIREEKDKNPMHMSPVEHQAMAITSHTFVGNFCGFAQFRKFFDNERGGDTMGGVVLRGDTDGAEMVAYENQ